MARLFWKALCVGVASAGEVDDARGRRGDASSLAAQCSYLPDGSVDCDSEDLPSTSLLQRRHSMEDKVAADAEADVPRRHRHEHGRRRRSGYHRRKRHKKYKTYSMMPAAAAPEFSEVLGSLTQCSSHDRCGDLTGSCCPQANGVMHDCCDLDKKATIEFADAPRAVRDYMLAHYPEANVTEVEWEIEHKDDAGNWLWNLEVEFTHQNGTELELDILPDGTVLELDEDD
eukprot:TRINITY_DN14076_c0_g1_i1.p1 TRINITY_DN14076_c0_g1~~TRINITY_DN14076_c0_g1_i1.p1  ORF type:complete len:229 (+),score=40.63 TRINITY_DN14076_c0_g1_i1:76-762(+)